MQRSDSHRLWAEKNVLSIPKEIWSRIMDVSRKNYPRGFDRTYSWNTVRFRKAHQHVPKGWCACREHWLNSDCGYNPI